MKVLCNLVGVVLSIGGFIAGIILWTNSENFYFCLLEWIGVFLFVVIYFGIAQILSNQEKIFAKLYNSPKEKTEESFNTSFKVDNKVDNEENVNKEEKEEYDKDETPFDFLIKKIKGK